MSFFGTIFDWATRVDREKLLTICEKKITNNENQEAISLAMKFIERRINSTSHSIEQKDKKDLDMGCSYYIVAKALYNCIKYDSAFRTYEIFKVFFKAHSSVYSVFQEYSQESKYFSYLQQTKSFYFELYEIYGNDPELIRADKDANDEISKIYRSVSF